MSLMPVFIILCLPIPYPVYSKLCILDVAGRMSVKWCQKAGLHQVSGGRDKFMVLEYCFVVLAPCTIKGVLLLVQ